MLMVYWADAWVWYCLNPAPRFCELHDLIARGDMLGRAVFDLNELDHALALGLASGAIAQGLNHSYAITEDWWPLVDAARQAGEGTIDGAEFLYQGMQEEFIDSGLILQNCISEEIYLEAVSAHKDKVQSALAKIRSSGWKI